MKKFLELVMEKIYFSIILAVLSIRGTSSACTFPDNLVGSWTSADKGVLNITNTSIIDYPILLSAIVDTSTFTCDDVDGDVYLLRGTPFNFGSDILRPHLCIELYTVSDDVMYYYLGSKIEPTNNERVHVTFAVNNVTLPEVCDRDKPYAVGTFNMLIREGTNISSSSRTCPTMFLRSFENVSILAHDNSSRCDGSRADVCDDTSVVQFTYDNCQTSLTRSSNGTKNCMFDITDGMTTYLAVWNSDPTVDNTNTFRLTCHAMTQQNNDIIYATEYPGSCQEGQTSTEVIANGVRLIYRDVSVNCALGPTTVVVTTTEVVNLVNDEIAISIATISVVVIATLLLLCVCLLFGCACKRFSRRKKNTLIIVRSGEVQRNTKVNGPVQTGSGNHGVWIENLEDSSINVIDTVPIVSAEPSDGNTHVFTISRPSSSHVDKVNSPQQIMRPKRADPSNTDQLPRKPIANATEINTEISNSTKVIRIKTPQQMARFQRSSVDSMGHSRNMEVDGSPKPGRNSNASILGRSSLTPSNPIHNNAIPNRIEISPVTLTYGAMTKYRHSSINGTSTERGGDISLPVPKCSSSESRNDKSENRVHFGTNKIYPIPTTQARINVQGDLLRTAHASKPYGAKTFSGTSTQTDISMGNLQTDDWKMEQMERGISRSYISPTYRFTYPKYHNSSHTLPYWELIRTMTQQTTNNRNGRSLWDAVHRPTRINTMPWRYWK